MKKILEGKLYDSDKCEVIASRDIYKNGNYAGFDRLLLAKNGNYLIFTKSNGIAFFDSDLRFWTNCDYPIDYFNEYSEEQLRRIQGKLKIRNVE